MRTHEEAGTHISGSYAVERFCSAMARPEASDCPFVDRMLARYVISREACVRFITLANQGKFVWRQDLPRTGHQAKHNTTAHVDAYLQEWDRGLTFAVAPSCAFQRFHEQSFIAWNGGEEYHKRFNERQAQVSSETVDPAGRAARPGPPNLGTIIELSLANDLSHTVPFH